MKSILFFLIIIILFINSQAQNFQWAKKGNKYSLGSDLVLDILENVYTVGSVIGNSNNSAILIEKHNTIGNLVWQHVIDGNLPDVGISISIDNNSNIFVTGSFFGTVDFDSGIGVNNLIATGTGENIFIAKYDTEGNFIWAKNIGGTQGNGKGQSICIDKNNNIYITGYFSGTIDFDTGLNTYNLTANNQDIFIAKLDNNGNLMWAKKIGGSGIDQGNDIRVDKNGNILTTGGYVGTVDFDPNAGIYNLTSVSSLLKKDVFISKLDYNGNFIWAKSIGGTNDDIGKSIEVDNNSNIYTTGYFIGVSDFDPSTNNYSLGTSSVSNDKNTYVSKFDSSGNFIWAKGLNSGLEEEGKKIRIDNNGTLFVIGNYKGSLTFPTSPNTTFSYQGGTDMFLCKINSTNGVFFFAKCFGGPDNDDFNSIAVNSNGSSIYTTGSFRKTVDFDPSYTGVFNLSTSDTSSYDKVTLKLGLPCFYVSLTANDTTDFCQGDSVLLSSNISSINGVSFQWQNNNNVITSGSNSTFNATYSGSYKVIMTYSNVCTANSNIINVTVIPLPNVSLDQIQSPICVNNSSIILSGSPSGGDFSGISVSGISFDPSVSGAGTFIINYTYSDANNCTAKDSQVVIVNLCTGFEELTNEFIFIYPNPISSNVSMKTIYKLIGKKYTIKDANGKLVLSDIINSEETLISMEEFAAGVYFISVEEFHKKIILIE